MANELWQFSELAVALGLPVSDGPAVTGVAIDSRRVRPGDLFVALHGDPGTRFTATARSDRDGHDYVAHALAQGAASALVHRRVDVDIPQLVVNDTLDGLWAVGRAARERQKGPVVAVTGSSGKTTFKSFAASALGAFATDGSLNNHIGVPLSLARTPKHALGAVYEIGTNHPGEIEPLSRLARPDVAVLLNVHPAHIEHFGSLAAIRKEKLTIISGLSETGTFVCPPALARDVDRATVTFGDQAGADVQVLDLSTGRSGGGQPGTTDIVRLGTPAGDIDCEVPGGGAHRAMSVAALAAVLVALNRPLEQLHRLANETVPAGRGNRIAAGRVLLIDESYNANPASMAAALRNFSQTRVSGRRIAILGDMLELGEGEVRYHAELAEHCQHLDGVMCAGRRIGALYDALRPDRRLGHAEAADAEFVTQCAMTLRPGDAVLVKGSNGVFWANGFVQALADALKGPDHV